MRIPILYSSVNNVTSLRLKCSVYKTFLILKITHGSVYAAGVHLIQKQQRTFSFQRETAASRLVVRCRPYYIVYIFTKHSLWLCCLIKYLYNINL